MSEEIKVYVVEFGDRNKYQMQYKDPMTGKKPTRSTGVRITGRKKDHEDALRVAAKWEAELREGRYASPSKVLWEDFRDRYSEEKLKSLARSTDIKVQGVFNLVEEHLKPVRLRDLTAARISYFQSKLREDGRSESTIAGYLAHLKAALRWAVDVGMLPKAPKIPKVHRVKGAEIAKGRPITGEEFERMLDKTAETVGEVNAAGWNRFLRGLWLSGLRLREGLDLSWDWDAGLCVDLSGKYPMLRIPAEFQKSNKDTLLPVTPDFGEFLLETPEDRRTGQVFHPMLKGKRAKRDDACRTISAIGAAAGVKVSPTKTASAHDLRRSFGARWAPKVMPQVLKELMRHATIQTTLDYYVGRNAETTAKAVWEAYRISQANSLANSQQEAEAANRRNSLQDN